MENDLDWESKQDIAARSRVGSPPTEWVRAQNLNVGDAVMLGNKNVHTVKENAPADNGLVRVVLADPVLAPVRDKPATKAPTAMPTVREVLVNPQFLYRRLASS